jgi:hypothetical protein
MPTYRRYPPDNKYLLPPQSHKFHQM